MYASDYDIECTYLIRTSISLVGSIDELALNISIIFRNVRRTVEATR